MYLMKVQSFLEREQAISSKSDINRQIKVLQFPPDKNTRYAILSHRWAPDTEEVNYEEMVELANMNTEKQDKIRKRVGYQKIHKSCEQAREDGLEWLWVDTCCIDKRSSTELSEAINSMYRWYEKSARCYAHLHDVPGLSFPTKPDCETYPRSDGWPEWFSRGWTLQELIAPHDVRFFNNDWQFIGDKKRHSGTLQAITRVPQNVLRTGLSLTRPCVAQMMSWAANRETSRVEDRAYSLLGLLDVSMPMLYGEGKGAFERLQLEIIRKSNDQSIFAWNPRGKIGRSGSVLADGPHFFHDCSDLQTMEINEFTEALKADISKEEKERLGSFLVTNRGIQIWLPLRPCNDSCTIFKTTLQCRAAEDQGPVTIYLTLWKSNYYRSFGPQSEDAFPGEGVPTFEQLHLRYQDVVYDNPIFKFDDVAVSELGFSFSSAFPDETIVHNKVELTSSKPLYVRTYAKGANSRFSVGFGQCFGQVWVHVMSSDEDDAEKTYNKMLITGPVHAKSMAETYYPGPSHICIKHTRLPHCTVRTSCVMWKDSKKYPVRIETITHHPGPCECLEKKAHDRIASIGLGHQVSQDASKRIGSSTHGDTYEGTLNPKQMKASGNGTMKSSDCVAVKVIRNVKKDVLMVSSLYLWLLSLQCLMTLDQRMLGGIYDWWNLAHENVAKLLGITADFNHTISIVSPLMPKRDAFHYVKDRNVDPHPLVCFMNAS